LVGTLSKNLNMARMNPKDGELAKHKVVMVFE
jgi:hypothetical protein